ncbi:Beta-glucan synthesis-associated protein KRE6 [Grifola frondosa]|uniref:Beta-glucan synthesis-associated protein KRE6 n=1 Tax=Grifola frondosa TaxID=5627 RepID=A0A1C7MS37_GRIFR|nr:Beta-glucan synthesis-associated protein KRE6 [Grifola frondosa]
MASPLRPNAQMRYNQPNSPSTTNLLNPSNGGHGVQGAQSTRSLRSVASDSSLNESRYASGKTTSIPPSISDKFSLSPDPSSWGADLSIDHPEQDDDLHNPDPRRDRRNDQGGNIFTYRGITNLGCLLILAVGLLTLFAGYPLISYFTRHKLSTLGGFNLGGINATGQVPSIPGGWGLIDLDTPQELYTKPDYDTGKDWQLIFSDEFNVDGRTFYPGDDPYWEAVNLHYWQTNNLEWYDPAAITTKNGSLQITLERKETHGLNFQGGMMSTWNKFCFTGGLVETSVVLPGINNIVGLWPAIWTMGNLGRAGYGASLEGMWPYTYDSCDVGTAPNQTLNGLPIAATENGDPSNGDVLSYLPGMSADHRNAVVWTGLTVRSMGPFNAEYTWFNTSATLIIPNATSFLNPYKGGVFQQATSVVTETDQTGYELTGNNYKVYGVQYQPGFDGAYITWIASGTAAWTLKQAGMAADTVVEIGSRPVPQEPMYLIMNLGMSTNFGTVDLEHLTFPTTMKVDWIRVYQDPTTSTLVVILRTSLPRRTSTSTSRPTQTRT